MAELTREDLKQHCIGTMEQYEEVAKDLGRDVSEAKSYQKHKMVLELIEKAEKLEKIEQIVDYVNNNKEQLFDDELAENLFEIVQIVKEV